MAVHHIKKGLNLPIAGAPAPQVEAARAVHRVALLAEDYVDLKPSFRVAAGDTVRRGQVLFEDKRTSGVLYTSPAAGTVLAIHRGARRALQSIVLELNEAELRGAPGAGDEVAFAAYAGADAAAYTPDQVRALLLESGLWTALRTRPFSKTPPSGTQPHSLFITASDTNPLAPPAEIVAAGREADLAAGVTLLTKLTEGKVYFCKTAGSSLTAPTLPQVSVEEFSGPHPSGTAGLHIHVLDPVGRQKTVWHIGLQDVLAIGALVRTGKLDATRIVSLAGPGVQRPRLLRTRLGAAVDELVAGELQPAEQRVISGSVLAGRIATGDIDGFLGRFHNQISVLPEGREREFLGWLLPGFDKFSIVKVFASALGRATAYPFTTSTNGSDRAMVPIGTYEKVMPFDIQPTFLLRSLIVNDIERAEELGCLELDEEDLALCTFVCPGKYEYGPILRRNLTLIEKEG
ncbi:MAG: Na(+)-translocating NADH-quinone reductase subunit A [Candidatus Hydrogenedentes bacterium]|nr:Na(+)-translocating NADH-quinone reductase subunit A [Candidatus Hydrogenedentota bacterium]